MENKAELSAKERILFKNFNSKDNTEFQAQLGLQSMRKELIENSMEEYSKLKLQEELKKVRDKIEEQTYYPNYDPELEYGLKEAIEILDTHIKRVEI